MRQASGWAGWLPGLLLVAALTALAFAIHNACGISPMIMAILIGSLANTAAGTGKLMNGHARGFGKLLLQLAVALLGVQLTFADISQIGPDGAVVAVAAVVSTYIFTVAAGRLLKIEPCIVHLMAAGCSICGASAVAASNAVVGAKEEDVAYAVASITILGTLAMVALPLLGTLLGLDARVYGTWVGASVHEVAQVVGSAFQGGQEAGQIGVLTKLARIMMLAPVMAVIAALLRSRINEEGSARPPAVTLFIVGFVALTAVNSLGLIPEQLSAPATAATPVMLTAALATLGLTTDLGRLRASGWRPLLLSAAASLFIAVITLALTLVLVS